MKIKILTLFPEMFTAVTESSILGKAGEKGILDIELINIRDFSKDKHKKADDYPFGGGVGMVMLAQPIFDALRHATGSDSSSTDKQENTDNPGATKSEMAEPLTSKKRKILYMSPRGKIIDQAKIEKLAEQDELVILCGHYEGVDQRVIDHWDMEEISIGDYILTGGELAAMVLIDSVSRFIPNVLGTKESAVEESIYSGLLEYDQYTKPRMYENLEVPEALFGGNHKLIHLWQFRNSLELTQKRRPDLFEQYLKENKKLTKEEQKILDEIVSKP